MQRLHRGRSFLSYTLWYALLPLEEDFSARKRIQTVNASRAGREPVMPINEKLRDDLTDKLFEAILTLETVDECYRFFEDIATIGEIKALAQRLEVAKMLDAGMTYEDIVAATGASTATISRVKKCLHYGADGYRIVLERARK